LLAPPVWAQANKPSELLKLQRSWANIKYHLPKAQRETALARLLERAHHISLTQKSIPNNNTAHAILWEAVILYTYVGEHGGFRALG